MSESPSAQPEEEPEELGPEIAALCRRFGLEPHIVKEIRIGLKEIEFTVYLRNAEGAKYVDVDKDGYVSEYRTGGVALTKLSHKISTLEVPA